MNVMILEKVGLSGVSQVPALTSIVVSFNCVGINHFTNHCKNSVKPVCLQ